MSGKSPILSNNGVDAMFKEAIYDLLGNRCDLRGRAVSNRMESYDIFIVVSNDIKNVY